MSERMIELQRAKIMAASQQKQKSGASSSSSAAGASAASQLKVNGSAAARTSQQQQQQHSTANEEDRQLRVFLQRLQRESSPTVPTALARRMLQRQGVGYMDSAVGAVASVAADRFLVTVLQQSIACRDQRLKGTELVRQAAKQRRRHLQQTQRDVDDRRRRREEAEAAREGDNRAAVRAMEEQTSKVAPSPSDTAKRKEPPELDGGARSKKRKKTDTGGGGVGINGIHGKTDDDEASYDSLDAEAEKYHSHFDDASEADGEDSDVDDDDEYMILRDVARPLGAWDFFFEGKLDDDPLGLRTVQQDATLKTEEIDSPAAQDEVIVIDEIDEQTANDPSRGPSNEDGKPSANGPISPAGQPNSSNGASLGTNKPGAGS